MEALSPGTGDPTVTGPTTWRPSGLVRVARKPVLYWALAALLAAATALTVYRVVTGAEAARASYGDTVEVFVTAAGIEPFTPLDPLVQRQAVPLALVPADAVYSLSPGAVAGRSVSPGAVLTLQDLATDTSLAPTEAAVSVPIGQTTPLLSPGQAIVVVINADPFAGLDSAQLAARVYAVDPERLTIAVSRNDLAALSAALATGSITIAIV